MPPTSPPRHVGLCAYCGRTAPLTRDHPVARSLFGPTPPPNLITVPACGPCNTAKSELDVYLRDYLVMDIQGHNHPVASSLFRTKVLRSFRRGSSALAKTLLASAALSPLYTPGGVYLGSAPQAPIDEPRLTEAIASVVRGLSFHYRKHPLSDTVSFLVRRHMPWHFAAVKEALSDLPRHTPKPLGTVFWCEYAVTATSPQHSLWLLSFYDRVVFSVATEPSANASA